MGLPARKMDAASATPRLRLVAAPARRASGPRKAKAGRSEAECRAVFLAVATVFLLFTAVALARVALTAQLAQAAFDAGKLRKDIKAQRLLTDRLEADRSTLMTPSRIESIASASMKMTKPRSVRYMALPATAATQAADSAPARTESKSGPPTVPDAETTARADTLGGIVSAAMDLAADEASALLVGDLGLASTR